MPATYADKPTSEWDYSHALAEGDEVVTQWGEVWEITTVEDDGNVRVRRLDDGRSGPDDRDTWDEDAVNCSLANGTMELKDDGQSHELATF